MPEPITHGWNLTPAEARALQLRLAGEVDEATPLDVANVRRVLAVDVSMNRFADWLAAAAVVCDKGTKQAIETVTAVRPIAFPYVPGLLSFRELPAVLDAIACVQEPFDAVVVDGHGVAHPRGLGIAAHLGLWLKKPTIGLAKSRLCGQFEIPKNERGERSYSKIGDRTIGMALRTRRHAAPIFVSVGNACRLTDAVALAMELADSRRIPWPVRAAHEAANQARRSHMAAVQGVYPPCG